jgi:S-adenosylmethionine decarboxylase
MTGCAPWRGWHACTEKEIVMTIHSKTTEQFGVHIMIDGYGAVAERLHDKAVLSSLLNDLPGEMGMHRICPAVVVEVGPGCTKDPGGLSGFVMIAESHISIHTFPARGFVTMDLYTCQCGLDRTATIARLMAAFDLQDADIHVQDRGLRYPALAEGGATETAPRSD